MHKLLIAMIFALSTLGGCGQGGSPESQGGLPGNAGGGPAKAAGLTGEYGGEECLYAPMSFRDSGTMYYSVFGVEQAGKYELDGDKVIVLTGAQNMVFTRKGDALEMNFMGETMRCGKLGSAPSTGVSAGVVGEYACEVPEGMFGDAQVPADFSMTLALTRAGKMHLKATAAGKSTEVPGTYKLEGSQLLVTDPHGKVEVFSLSADGAIHAPDGTRCRKRA